jgi:hypothetical protein
MVKAEKGDLSHGSRDAVGRGKVSTQLILSYIDMNYRFNKQKNCGQRTKVCIVKQS